MKIAIRLQIEAGDGGPCDEEILSLDKPHNQLERLGLSLAEALLAGEPVTIAEFIDHGGPGPAAKSARCAVSSSRPDSTCRTTSPYTPNITPPSRFRIGWRNVAEVASDLLSDKGYPIMKKPLLVPALATVPVCAGL